MSNLNNSASGDQSPPLLYDQPFLTINEAARALGVSPHTIRNRLYEDRDRKEAGERGGFYFPNAYKAGNGRNTSTWRIPEQDITHYKKRIVSMEN